jgi:PAS domain S-box-containing protein
MGDAEECAPEGRLLRQALAALPDGVALIDDGCVIRWVNEWVERRFADRAPLVGRRCHEVLWGRPESCPDCEKAVGHPGVLLSPRVLEHVQPKGEVRWYEISVHGLFEEDGRSAGGLVHVRDITAHRRVEQELADEVTRRRLLVEQSRDGVVILDGEGQVYETNLQFARMLGYSLEEMASLHVWDWEYLYPKERVEEMLRTVDGAGDHFETQHRRKDGSIYDVEISTNGAVIGGKKYVFCVCRDVSERKKAEREREALIRQLQEALAEIKLLRGMVPICSYCKRVRDDEGYWHQVEEYIEKNAKAGVTHGICPECAKKHFPDLDLGDG